MAFAVTWLTDGGVRRDFGIAALVGLSIWRKKPSAVAIFGFFSAFSRSSTVSARFVSGIGGRPNEQIIASAHLFVRRDTTRTAAQASAETSTIAAMRDTEVTIIILPSERSACPLNGSEAILTAFVPGMEPRPLPTGNGHCSNFRATSKEYILSG